MTSGGNMVLINSIPIYRAKSKVSNNKLLGE
jgi:hypothetical protein